MTHQGAQRAQIIGGSAVWVEEGRLQHRLWYHKLIQRHVERRVQLRRARAQRRGGGEVSWR
eukprot:3053871-Prymnesium_polylepis.2